MHTHMYRYTHIYNVYIKQLPLKRSLFLRGPLSLSRGLWGSLEASLVITSLDCVCVVCHWQLMGCGLSSSWGSHFLLRQMCAHNKLSAQQFILLSCDEDLTESIRVRACVCLCTVCLSTCTQTHTHTPCLRVCVESGRSLTGSELCHYVHINKQDPGLWGGAGDGGGGGGGVRGRTGRRLLSEGL